MDALSHHSGAEDEGESNGDALRQATAGLEEKEAAPVAPAGDCEQDMRRLFRMCVPFCCSRGLCLCTEKFTGTAVPALFRTGIHKF